MKRILFIVLIIICACKGGMAQSPTSAKIAVGSSYVSTTYTDVYPYQSGQKPKIDSSIHFKLNKGTKFTIVAVKEAGGTTLGYIITPWKYKDSTVKTDSTAKTKFYKKIADFKKQALKNQKRILDSILRKQDSLKLAKTQLEKDSLKVELSKQRLTQTQQEAIKSSDRLLTKAVNLNIKRDVAPKMLVKQPTKDFSAVQVKAKAKLSAGIELDSTLKTQLIYTAMQLPLKPRANLKKYSAELLSQQSRLRNAEQAANDAVEDYEDNKTEYATGVQEVRVLTGQLHSHAIQYDDKKLDPLAYKITKEAINDQPDIVDIANDISSPAALYDDLAYLDSWANGWQFFVSAKDFSENCIFTYPSSHKFTWGFLTLPVKMRFDNNTGGRFDFEQNLNFGLTFGDKHQLVSTSDISLNYLIGLSVVNVPLNDATASTSATSTTAVSTSIGFMLQYDKFQIGAFLGSDFAGSHANKFNYQGKPWLGLAIGISLFGEGKTTASAQEQTSNP